MNSEDIKNIVSKCINLALKVPGPLKEAFCILKWIWDGVNATKTMQKQLFTLSGALAHLLQTLACEHQDGRLAFENTDKEIVDLKWSVVNSCSIQYQWLLTRIAERLVCSKKS